MKPERGDLALLVALGTIWGAAFPVIRLGLLAGASPLAFGAGRFAIATALLTAVTAARRIAWPSRRDALVSAVFGGLLLVGGYAAFLYEGEEVLGGGLSAVLVATVPLWTAVLGFALLPTERVGRWGWGALGVGFLGVVVLFLPDLLAGTRGGVEGGLLVLGAALVAGAGTVGIRRFLPHGVNLGGLTVQFAVATALLAGLGLVPGIGLAFAVNATTVGTVLYLALVPSVLGFIIYYGLVHRGGATRASLVTYVNPLAGVVVGVLLLSEAVTLYEVAGFALIVIGLYLFQRFRPATSRGGSAHPPSAPRPAR